MGEKPSKNKKNRKPKIRYLDGRRLRRALLAGSRSLLEQQDELNRINVFPVPDGDTGTNMAATAQSIAEALEHVDSPQVRDVSQVAAESALMGARGNSGVILAQFFQGLHEDLRDKDVLTTQEFGEAVYRAAERSSEALAEPREGTILTVLREWAQHVRERSKHVHDFAELLKQSLHAARQSLAETPKKLEILRQSGVVDAGAKGFVHMLEGVVTLIETGKVRGAVAGRHLVNRVKHLHWHDDPAKIRYRYCTQCLVEGVNLDKARIRRELRSLGDSLIVIGGRERIRVHIHSNEPERVFKVLGAYGRVSGKRADDMKRQHLTALGQQEREGIAVVTDTACDLPDDYIKQHDIHLVPLQLNIGPDTYQDRLEMTPQRFYRMLPELKYHPRTSQPTPAAFLRAYQMAGRTRTAIISIHLAAVLSGTYQNALNAAKRYNDVPVRVVDAKTASVAQGLVVQEAVRAIEEGLSLDEVVKRVEQAVANQKIFLVVPTLTYLIRGGRVSKPKGFIGSLLGVKPIITLDDDGRIIQPAKSLSEKGALKKALSLAERFIKSRNFTNIRFGVAHAAAPEKADWYVREIQTRFGVDDILVVEACPTLGAHAGPGAAAVAVLGS